MRLSEIKGERVFDVMAEIVDPIISIAEDETAAEIFTPKKKPDGVTAYRFFMSRLRQSLPKLIDDHREDFVKILSSINGIEPSEYIETLTATKLIADVVELVTDREFKSFFG